MARSVRPTSQAFFAISAKLTSTPPSFSNFSTIASQIAWSSMPASVVVDGLDCRIFAQAQCFRTADGGRCKNEEIRRARRCRLRAVSREMSCAGDSLMYLLHNQYHPEHRMTRSYSAYVTGMPISKYRTALSTFKAWPILTKSVGSYRSRNALPNFAACRLCCSQLVEKRSQITNVE